MCNVASCWLCFNILMMHSPMNVKFCVLCLCGDRPVVPNILNDQSAFLCRFEQSKAAQNPEDEGTTVLQSTGNYSPKDTASHCKAIVTMAVLCILLYKVLFLNCIQLTLMYDLESV